MATITLKGNEIHTSGNLPKVSSQAPDFKLVKSDLSELDKAALKGKKSSSEHFSKSGYRCLCCLCASI